MRKIPVTKGFDKVHPIGFLTLHDDVDIPPDSVFALGYVVEERADDGTPTKIQVWEVSLVSASEYQQANLRPEAPSA